MYSVKVNMAAELKVFITSLLQKIESRSNPEMGPYHVSDFDRQRATISSAEYARCRAINRKWCRNIVVVQKPEQAYAYIRPR